MSIAVVDTESFVKSTMLTLSLFSIYKLKSFTNTGFVYRIVLETAI